MTDSPYIEHDDRDDEKLTEIVSYLDGELEDTQMVEIEQQLIQDPDLRSHADILSRTWALLDELDGVSASQKFTQDTLATVAAESVSQEETRPRNRLRSAGVFLAKYKVAPCFLAGLIGGIAGLSLSTRFIETRHTTSALSANSLLLENFDLLQRTELYLSVPDAESLEALSFPAIEVPSQSGDNQ